MTLPISELIKTAEFFAGISQQFRQDVMRTSLQKSVLKGAALFHELEPGTAFFLLAAGTIRLFKTAADGRETTIRLAQPGDVFAEVILFENPTYPVSAVAVTDARVLQIAKRDFLHLLNNTEFRDEFIAMLIGKQRYLAQRIQYLTAFDVEERFFRFLLERFGKQTVYRVDIPKKELAAAIGTIPETFSRLILRLKKRGVLTWDEPDLVLEEGFWDQSGFFMTF